MARKARQRISYVLEYPNSTPGGHRLGVNGLAVDPENAILYSGGRDGVVCAWDLSLDLGASKPRHSAVTDSVLDFDSPPSDSNGPPPRPNTTTRFRKQTLAHTHWINDIALAHHRTLLVSASSDMLVKAWRPHTAEGGGSGGEDGGSEPVILGQHDDFVKCLAAPSQSSTWIASGGLNKKVFLWDLAGGGVTLEIDVTKSRIEEGFELCESTAGEAGAASRTMQKTSVYALDTNPGGMLASGGPERLVRLWDVRSGKQITKLVGHTDIIRSLRISQSGTVVISASSDQTVKLWDITAGRCMHTLTMHNDSIWSLFSQHPDLQVLYTADRSGLVVKTDMRTSSGDMDDGLSLVIAQEHMSVRKVVACGGYIWTASTRSSINRWRDVNTTNVQVAATPESFRPHAHRRPSSTATTATGRTRQGSLVSVSGVTDSPFLVTPTGTATGPGSGQPLQVPLGSVLRISNTAPYPPATRADADADEMTIMSGTISVGRMSRRGSEMPLGQAAVAVEPIYQLPEETIEGQFGLVKHMLLNDRRRVLTLDTAGDVLLWDLIQCRPIKSFGKQHLEDVEPLVNTLEAVAPWCTIHTSSGNLTVALEPFNCFDAETYFDELETTEPVEYREDQRINLGKWVLRYLFANLVDEELRRDEAYRQKLSDAAEEKRRRGATGAGRAHLSGSPISITIPEQAAYPPDWPLSANSGSVSPRTPRAGGMQNSVMTPGYGIGTATPLSQLPPQLASVGGGGGLGSPTSPSMAEKRFSQFSQTSWPADREDYFSSVILAAKAATVAAGGAATINQELSSKQAEVPQSPGIAAEPRASEDKSSGSKDDNKDRDQKKGNERREGKEKGGGGTGSLAGSFGKKFRMGMSFGGKKLRRSASSRQLVPADKGRGGSSGSGNGDNKLGEGGGGESESSSSHDKENGIDDSRQQVPSEHSFLGVVQRIRAEYDRQAAVAEFPPPLPPPPLHHHHGRPVMASRLYPSLPSECPVLRLPGGTKVIIQEERSGGSAELYRGTVATVGQAADVDAIEARGPRWLAEVLLTNALPHKDPQKISFVLYPSGSELPPVSSTATLAVPETAVGVGAASDGNNSTTTTNTTAATAAAAAAAATTATAGTALVASLLPTAGSDNHGPSNAGAGDALSKPGTASGTAADGGDVAAVTPTTTGNGAGNNATAATANAGGTGTAVDITPRLNANRMIRVKKILAYVAEKIVSTTAADPDGRDAGAPLRRPEEWLELVCNDKVLPPNMSLLTLRTHVWKGGNDILLYYRLKAGVQRTLPWSWTRENEETGKSVAKKGGKELADREDEEQKEKEQGEGDKEHVVVGNSEIGQAVAFAM